MIHVFFLYMFSTTSRVPTATMQIAIQSFAEAKISNELKIQADELLQLLRPIVNRLIDESPYGDEHALVRVFDDIADLKYMSTISPYTLRELSRSIAKHLLLNSDWLVSSNRYTTTGVVHTCRSTDEIAIVKRMHNFVSQSTIWLYYMY